MSTALVLDAEAMSALAGARSKKCEEVRAAMEAARRLRRDVVLPAVILAELYRGAARSKLIDSCISRESGLMVRDTDREFARLVGGVLAAAGASSRDLADAHAVAVAVERGGGVVITGDAKDLERLAAPYPTVVVSKI